MKVVALIILSLALVGCGQSGSSASTPAPQVLPSGQIVIPPQPTPLPKPACGTISACERLCYSNFPWVDDKVIERQDSATVGLQSGAHIKHIQENHARMANYAACIALPADQVIPGI